MKIETMIKSLVVSCVLILSAAVTIQAQNFEKRGQTTMKFLSVSLDAKANALGEANTSLEGGSESMFYNPANMSRFDGTISTTFSQVQWIADINYSMAGLAYRPASGRYGVFGLNVMAVDYGSIDETILASNERGYLKIGSYSPTAFAAGVSYARAISSQFSVGANVKFVTFDLAKGATDIIDAEQPLSGDNVSKTNFSESTIAYDFGVHYITGWKSLNFAFVVRNFSQQVDFDDENAELPLTMKIGLSMDLMDFTSIDKDMHSVMLSVDAKRPRDFYEQVLVGLDYTFLNSLSVRGGYGYPNEEQGVSFGGGVNQRYMGVGFEINYSYSDFGVFDNVNTFSLKLNF